MFLVISKLTKTYVLLLILAKFCESANILYMMTYPGKSHYIMLRPIGLELARRGHNVTVITPFKETDPPPNYHQVMIDEKTVWDMTGEARINLFDSVDMSVSNLLKKVIWSGGLAITEMVLNSSEVTKFLAKDNSFDIVISQYFSQEALFMLSHKYNAPLVLISTFGNSMKYNVLSSNPLQLATVLHDYAYVDETSSFLGRLKNIYYTTYEYFWWNYWNLKNHEQLVRKYMPNLAEPVPSIEEVQKNASLFLMNSHFSFDTPVAYLPNIVEIGGAHLVHDDRKPLPEDLQQILDSAKYGVVYISFGSNLRSSELPSEKKDAFLNVFRRLKTIVLWKWEDEQFENKPNNIITRKWFPQKEILSHPNVHLYINHGGKIGTQEAIWYGIPILGIPIFADQYKTMQLIQGSGCGRILHYHQLTEETLETLINELLNNDTYIHKAKELSAKFKDRPMSPLDTAVFWIEHVIRNKGANYMKSPARKLTWITYSMLDIYVFIILLIILFGFMIVKIVVVFLRFTRIHGNDVHNKSDIKIKTS